MPKYNPILLLPNIYLSLHVITIHLSYIAFFVASISAGLYLFQNKMLKHKQPRVIFNRLPNLFFLDKLNYLAIGFGFPLLTLSIISGFLWLKHIRGTYFLLSQREIFSIALWLIYAFILHVRLAVRLRGMKVARLSLFAFCVIIFTLWSNCR